MKTLRFVLLLIVFAVAAACGEPSQSAAVADEPSDEDSVNPLAAGRSRASSELSAPASKYPAYHAFDDNPRTAWCEGKADMGEGEALIVEYDEARTIRKLYLIGGLGANKHFISNSRAYQLALNDMVFDIDPFDPGLQTIELPEPVSADRFRLRIHRAIPGLKWTDTCLAGVWFEESPDLALELVASRHLAALPDADVLDHVIWVSRADDEATVVSARLPVAGVQCEPEFVSGRLLSQEPFYKPGDEMPKLSVELTVRNNANCGPDEPPEWEASSYRLEADMM